MGLARTAVTIRGEEDNPISPDANIRAKGVELTKQTLDCCAAAGVETLVGPYHSALGILQWCWPYRRRVEMGRRQHATSR